MEEYACEEDEDRWLFRDKERVRDVAVKRSGESGFEPGAERPNPPETARHESADRTGPDQDTAQLRNLLHDRIKRIQELENERTAAAIKIKTLERKLAALERAAEENVHLTGQVFELPELRNVVAHLTAENRELRSRCLVKDAPPPPPANAAFPEDLSGSMRALTDRFEAELGASGRGVALADKQGLLVGGSSEYAEGLAVAAALGDATMKQIADILPLGSLYRLTIVDTNANTVTLHPFRFGSGDLLLATLSVGSSLSDEAYDALIDEVSSPAEEETGP